MIAYIVRNGKIIDTLDDKHQDIEKLADEFKIKYDNEHVISYELIFKDHIKMEQIHYLEDLDSDDLKEVKITLK